MTILLALNALDLTQLASRSAGLARVYSTRTNVQTTAAIGAISRIRSVLSALLITARTPRMTVKRNVFHLRLCTHVITLLKSATPASLTTVLRIKNARVLTARSPGLGHGHAMEELQEDALPTLHALLVAGNLPRKRIISFVINSAVSV